MSLFLDFSDPLRALIDSQYKPRGFMINLSINGFNVLHIEAFYWQLALVIMIIAIITRILKKHRWGA